MKNETRRLFAIGETVWDESRAQWGKVIMLKHSSASKKDMMAPKDAVTYAHRGNAYNADAEFCYQAAKEYRFRGERLCWEHRATKHDYPFYCPAEDENVFFFEVDEKSAKI